MRYPLPEFPLSEGPRRCIRRTTRDYRSYRSSRTVCRFGRSGSSGFVGSFRRLLWSGYVPVPEVRAYRTCPTSGLEVSCWLQFANYFNLDMYRMPFPIITIKFIYII